MKRTPCDNGFSIEKGSPAGSWRICAEKYNSLLFFVFSTQCDLCIRDDDLLVETYGDNFMEREAPFPPDDVTFGGLEGISSPEPTKVIPWNVSPPLPLLNLL